MESHPAEIRIESLGFVVNNFGNVIHSIFLLEIHNALSHLKD